MRKSATKQATPAGVVEERRETSRERAPLLGVVVARLVAVDPDGSARIAPSGAPDTLTLEARLAAPLKASDVGSEVAVVFERGDLDRPIVIGKVESFPMARPVALRPQAPTATTTPKTARLDGETIVFEAEKEIVLRCGEATITLTRAGKILIQGAYVSSRSTGLNRVRGGAVQIN